MIGQCITAYLIRIIGEEDLVVFEMFDGGDGIGTTTDGRRDH